MLRALFGIALLLSGATALAQEAGESPLVEGGEIPAPPPMPEKKPQPDIPPPTVTIRRQEGKLMEEYSINGRVYMVRVTPENAPPYYLLDMDGDGELRRAESEVGPHVLPPHWVIFEWD